MTPEDEDLNRKIRERFESITQHFPSSEALSAAYERSNKAILTEIKGAYPAARIHNVGPDRAERSDWWECYLEVDTDERRDALRRDDLLMQRLREAGRSGGFPPAELEIESQETVNRLYGGNWFNRLR